MKMNQPLRFWCDTKRDASEGPCWRFALGVTAAEICTQKRKSQ